MLAKTSGAILFGVVNAFVPIVLAMFLTDLSQLMWAPLLPGIVIIAIASTFLGLFIAVSVSEVFEAQTLSNFFRFPMMFLCGLFFPISSLPVFLRPISYMLPLTYGVDILHGAVHGGNIFPLALDFLIIAAFSILMFYISIRNIHMKWIV
jgi:ABC-2 type transport system permease protein